MRSTTTLLIVACCLLSGVLAEPQINADQDKCIQNLPVACNASSASTCKTDYDTFAQCQLSKCGSTSTLSDYATCLTNQCASSNTDVQNFSKGIIACIYSSILSLSVAFSLILALLF